MKKNEKKKALELKLATLRNLDSNELAGVNGGAICTRLFSLCPKSCVNTY